MIANLVEARCRDARVFCVYDEYRECIRSTGLTGACSHQKEISDRAVGNVELAPIEDEIVSIQTRIGPNASDVASRIGFGQSECADAPTFYGRLLEFRLLLRRPQIDDGAEGKVLVGEYAGRNACRRTRELLIEETAHDQIPVPPANRFRIVDAEIAGLSQQIVYFERKDMIGLRPPINGC